MKGIKVKEMPSYWYNRKACHGDPKLLKICADKKPYFMIYRYPMEYEKYKQYKNLNNLKGIWSYGDGIYPLLHKDILTQEENKMLEWYYKKFPVGINNCSVNNICRYIEYHITNCKNKIKKQSNFDYTLFMNSRRCYDAHVQNMINLYNQFTKRNEDSEYDENRVSAKEWFSKKAEEICPNEDERVNIIIKLCYENNKNIGFCWSTIGDILCRRAKELNENNI